MSKQPSQQMINLVGFPRKIQHSFGFVGHRELNVELFAGAGGFGAGAAMAGLTYDIAINHNPAALAVHRANAPHATQMINDVFEYNPITVLLSQGASLDVIQEVRNWRSRKLERYLVGSCHLSPDCTFHSRAKGKKKVLKRHTICGDHCSVDQTKLSKDVAERIRGLAWVGVGWCAVARPRRVTLENVLEFMKWGPTMVDEDGDIVPDETREGETFNAFVGVLSTGIDAIVPMKIPNIVRFVNPLKIPKRKPKAIDKKEWDILKLWLVDVQNEVSKNPLAPWHGWKQENPALEEMRRFLKPFLGEDYNEQDLIDGLGYDVEFKELVASDYGAPTSRKRLFMIARCDGVPIKWPKITHGDPKSDAVKSGELLPWRTAGECIDWSIIAPSIFDSKEEIKEKHGISAKRPIADSSLIRIALGAERFVINTNEPYIVKINHSHDAFRGQNIHEPLQTLTSKNGYGIAMPYIQTYYGLVDGSEFRGSSLRDPLRTITAGGLRHGLVVPYVQNGLSTTAAYIMNAKGTKKKSMYLGHVAHDPMTTITTSDTHGVIFAHLQREFGQSIGSTLFNPAPTIMAGGGGKTSLIAAHCIKMKGDNIGYGCNGPVQTITAGGLSHGLIASELLSGERFMYHTPMSDDQRYKAWQVARLLEVYGNAKEPMLGGIRLPRRQEVRTASGDIIVDIGMRMLTVRELYTASGFMKSFIFDPKVEVIDAFGKRKIRHVTKTESVRMVGNAVPPHFACALISALDEAEDEYYAMQQAA